MGNLIYIADDEKNIRDLISAFLSQEGFEIKTFENGNDLLDACNCQLPDLVILDIIMPGIDGLSVCSLLRKISNDISIIILSAKDSPYDRVTGLTIGSDDYMVKPFLPLELVARVHSILRRTAKKELNNNTIQQLNYGPLSLFPERRIATLNMQPISFTPTEFEFLSYLIIHKDKAVSRHELLNALWNVNWQADTRVTDDLVKRLRRKLRSYNSSIKIDTVWGFGFRISMED